MLIILDKLTKRVKENLGTNSLFPSGNIPIEEKQDEIYVRLQDNSDFAKQISTAYEYELVLDRDNEVTNVIVHKTLEQYQAEQPIVPQPSTEIQKLTNYVLDVDFRLVMIEMGL